jgi:Cd2+/Zn2+-exporting ATPase/Cu+-exporting ATPase
LELSEPHAFESFPGVGVRATVDGHEVAVGSRRILDIGWIDKKPGSIGGVVRLAREHESSGKTNIFVIVDGRLAGLLAAADVLRPEVPQAIDDLRELGIKNIELLTGDNQLIAAALAEHLNIPFRAELLPEDKIQVVIDYQTSGRRVVMIGDGVNDAPALAQADVGIAMGTAGSDVAVEAAHVALMREDWSLVPEVIRISRRTMAVVKMNIAFTAVYNIVGLTLAAFGFLPPVLAAAAQSLPDLGILANSSRLLRQK